MGVEVIFFFVLALGLVVTSLLVVTFRNPIHSAVSLVGTFLLLAGVYALLNATFLAVIQIMVYAGAILVLFLFVIMLLNLGDDELGEARFTVGKFVAVAGAVGLLGALVAGILGIQDKAPIEVTAEMKGQSVSQVVAGNFPDLNKASASRLVLQNTYIDGEKVKDAAQKLEGGELLTFSTTRYPGLVRRAEVPGMEDIRLLHLTEEEIKTAQAEGEDIKPLSSKDRRALTKRVALWNQYGSIEDVGRLIYTKWFFVFEVTALLLFAAIVGAVVLAKRRL